jgi:hypothetical protein
MKSFFCAKTWNDVTTGDADRAATWVDESAGQRHASVKLKREIAWVEQSTSYKENLKVNKPGTKSNDMVLAADPKLPIPKLSKIVLGKNGKNMV